MKRVLVTGAAGFIGSDFVDMTLENHPESEVIAVDALTYAGDEENLEGAVATGRCRFVHGDVRDEGLMDELVAAVDGVVHFAAESMVDRSVLDPQRFIESNVVGTGSLLLAARRHAVERFLYISTPEVYGQRLGDAAREDEVFRPRNVYAASKAAAELLCVAHINSFELPIVFTRGAVAFGPRQYPEKVTPLWITNAIDELPLPVYGDGSAVRDFIHVRDLNLGNDTALRKGAIGEAYNVVANQEMSLSELADHILTRLDRPASLLQSTPSDRPGHDYRYHMDDSKLRALGWAPVHDLESAMDSTVQWYVDNQDWWRRKKDSDDFKAYMNRNVSFKPTVAG